MHKSQYLLLLVRPTDHFQTAQLLVRPQPWQAWPNRAVKQRHEIHRRDNGQGTATMLYTWLLILDRHSRHYNGGIVPLLYDAASAVLNPATGTASGAYCVEVTLFSATRRV
jgi:hypothetical protein